MVENNPLIGLHDDIKYDARTQSLEDFFQLDKTFYSFC